MAQRWKDWLAQAEHDLEQADSSLGDGRHDWACFAAHQAAEKAAKALHLARGQEAWGHVVARLLVQAPVPVPERLVEQARVLDTYYVPARYPNGHPEGAPFEHYEGKVIRVNGVVDSIGEDLLGDPFVSLTDGSEFSFQSVQCFFADSHRSDFRPGRKSDWKRLPVCEARQLAEGRRRFCITTTRVAKAGTRRRSNAGWRVYPGAVRRCIGDAGATEPSSS